MSKNPKNRFASRRRARRATSVLLAGLVCGVPSWADHEARDLTELSLEALMNIEVTSAAKREQPLAETAAATYVITREEIRRSGMTSIPELLRMVPGLHVARIDANRHLRWQAVLVVDDQCAQMIEQTYWQIVDAVEIQIFQGV